MSIRHVLKTVAVSGAATACAAVFALGVGSGVAGANTLTSPDGNTTLNTVGAVTAGTPYSSGQSIAVNVGANSTLNTSGQTGAGAPAPSGSYYFEECEDPGGTTANLPTTYAGCEAGTLDIEQGTISTGAVSSPSYPVYTLPDVATVGGPTMTTPPAACGLAPNYCVIGIFSANPNFGHPGFTYPHLFSAPFQVKVGDGLDAGDSPGDGTPEVPLAIGLPLAAIGVFGGVVLVRRNRRRHEQQAA